MKHKILFCYEAFDRLSYKSIHLYQNRQMISGNMENKIYLIEIFNHILRIFRNADFITSFQ